MFALVSLSESDFPFASLSVCRDILLAFQWDTLVEMQSESLCDGPLIYYIDGNGKMHLTS